MQGDFVIQVRPDVDLDRGIFSGRVEHVDSGQSARFRNVEELLAFVQRFARKSDSQPLESR
jgi:prophage DNA circulation protein